MRPMRMVPKLLMGWTTLLKLIPMPRTATPLMQMAPMAMPTLMIPAPPATETMVVTARVPKRAMTPRP